jgi:hypothetical protein
LLSALFSDFLIHYEPVNDLDGKNQAASPKRGRLSLTTTEPIIPASKRNQSLESRHLTDTHHRWKCWPYCPFHLSGRISPVFGA